jgi:hypothetical protein
VASERLLTWLPYSTPSQLLQEPGTKQTLLFPSLYIPLLVCTELTFVCLLSYLLCISLPSKATTGQKEEPWSASCTACPSVPGSVVDSHMHSINAR